jgi:hypothetical protein
MRRLFLKGPKAKVTRSEPASPLQKKWVHSHIGSTSSVQRVHPRVELHWRRGDFRGFQPSSPTGGEVHLTSTVPRTSKTGAEEESRNRWSELRRARPQRCLERPVATLLR